MAGTEEKISGGDLGEIRKRSVTDYKDMGYAKYLY